jgi:hypothetical protein
MYLEESHETAIKWAWPQLIVPYHLYLNLCHRFCTKIADAQPDEPVHKFYSYWNSFWTTFLRYFYLALYFDGKQIVETFIFTAEALWTRLRSRQSIVLPRCQINKYYATTEKKERTVLEPVPLIKWGILENLAMCVLLRMWKVTVIRFRTENHNISTVKLISD